MSTEQPPEPPTKPPSVPSDGRSNPDLEPQLEPPPPQPYQLHHLTATYKNASSPTSPDPPKYEPHFTLTHALPPLLPTSVSSKTAYLSTLRQAVSELQGNINKELTGRMEEDKLRLEAEIQRTGGVNGVGAETKKKDGKKQGKRVEIDEAKEEERYGEEEGEEDD